MLPEQELAELVERAGRGDSSAFEALVRSTEALVAGVVLRLVPDRQEAEEVMQDVYVDAHRALPNWQPGARFTTWLYRAATLASLAHRRSRGRYQRHLRAAGEQAAGARAPAPDVATRAIATETGARVAAAVQSLPPRQRAVFVLRHYRDLPVREIAGVLGISESTVKAHLVQAVETLRKNLASLQHGKERRP